MGFLVGWFYGGIRENTGDAIIRLFPTNLLKTGNQVDIFLNGQYNRTATISKVTADKLYIFDTVQLPICYRGTFYAIGYDDVDGSQIVYLARPKEFRYVCLAELVRKTFNVIDCFEMLPVSIDDYSNTEIED